VEIRYASIRNMSEPPGSAPEPANDSDKDRLVTKRGIALSLLGAIVAAFIGAAASYIAAVVTANSQAQQAREDFIRTQRQAVYSKMIADASSLTSDSAGCVADAEDPKSQVKPATIQKYSLQFTPATKVLNIDSAAVQVIGSTKAAEDAKFLSLYVGLATGGCATVLGTRGTALPRDAAGALSILRVSDKASKQYYFKLIDDARVDLQG
jgi:hypothetical protein